MADQDKQAPTRRQISDDERFHFIGFEVCPGKPKDLFTSEAEKAKLVDVVVKKRSTGQILREQCSLLFARVSKIEKTVLIVACLIALVSLVVPWYSAYNEVEEKAAAPTASSVAPSTQTPSGGNVETITGYQVRAKIHRTPPETLMGITSITAIGSLFSSGFILMLTAVIMLAYTLATLGLPIYLLMQLFKAKTLSDEFALEMKRLLRFCWIPVILLVSAFVLSFFGADYGPGVASGFSSLGKSYGPGAFLGTLSWGVLMSLGAFMVLAFKGIEI